MSKAIASQKKYLRFIFRAPASETRDFFIVLLSQLPFEGIVEEEEEFHAFVANNAWSPEHFHQLNELVSEYKLNYDLEEVQPKNWNAEWEANYQPILIPKVAYVRASFHKVLDLAKSTIEIVIDPKMSFGTGHHATTRMMLEELHEHDVKKKRVLDFGAGTGILSIAAAMWEAKKVFAIEIDPVAYENMLDNLRTNKIKNFKAICGDKKRIPDKKFDIILANVNKKVLLDIPDIFRKRCRIGGQLLLSGILEVDRKEITKAYREQGFKVQNVRQEGDWVMIAMKKKK